MNDCLKNNLKGLFSHLILVLGTAQSKQTRPVTSLSSFWIFSLLNRPHSLFLFEHSGTRPGISLCSWPRLSLPSKGLFLVRWQCGDTGLLHPILFLWILNLLWKLHGPLGPYSGSPCEGNQLEKKMTFLLKNAVWVKVDGVQFSVMRIQRNMESLGFSKISTPRMGSSSQLWEASALWNHLVSHK